MPKAKSLYLTPMIPGKTYLYRRKLKGYSRREESYVLEQMKNFDSIARGKNEKFLKLFNQMKQDIIKNPDMLYKNYWQNVNK